MSRKVVVTGSINGQLEVFTKLSKLHKSNAFSLALISGDLFADPEESTKETENEVSALLSGQIDISFPTYFTVAKNPLPSNVQSKLREGDGELCTNLYFLGKHSVTKTSEGLRLVILGGLLDSNLVAGLSKEEYTPCHTVADVESLFGARHADILVTSPWPSGIRSGSQVALQSDGLDPSSETCVADLCSTLKPRYHFSVSDHFFEREPFFHPSDDDTLQITRFISLAGYGNKLKQKWLYAFAIDPTTIQSTALPARVTGSPFLKPLKKHQRPLSEDGDRHYGSKRFKKRGPPPGPESCFFCLSNPNLATHLITSIGNDSYLTTAKGPLPTAQTFSLGFPGHILIIPLSHSATVANISPGETRRATFTEMERYRRALGLLMASASKGALGSVTWEISRSVGIHVHWQFMPIPAELVRKGLVEAAFRVEAENENYGKYCSIDIQGGSQAEGDFLRVWIWRAASLPADAECATESEEGEEMVLLLELKFDTRFDLQFPRKVLAKLLGLEKRLHWKDCAQTETEETAEAEAFKFAFKPFEIS